MTGFTYPLRKSLAVLLLAWASATLAGSPPADGTVLGVPLVRQTPERCGQAALEMVLRYYGADAEALHEGDRAYNPALRGSLITDLAAAARRAGYEAEIATLTPDSLIALLAAGVPPVVLYQRGRRPLTVPHFGVVTGWDPAREVFTLNDGGAHPRVVQRDDLAKRWRTAGFQTLIVRRRAP
jgi:ABC-type bacteriocin/lantibiotic exporter with double-glycine peptidase domain